MHQILIYIPRLDFKDLINLWPFTNKHLLCDVYIIMSHTSQQKEYFENLYCKDLLYYIYYISLSSLTEKWQGCSPALPEFNSEFMYNVPIPRV